MNFKNGFTILEILVVMSILAVLATIGVFGLVTLRQSIQVQQAHGEFISMLRQTQNFARNSVASQTLITQTGDPLRSLVDGYAISFDSSANYSIRYCRVSGNNMDCRGVEQTNVKGSSYSDVTIAPFGGTACKVIYFNRLNGDISGMSSDLTTRNDISVCVIRITHNQTGRFKSVTIDFTGNSIKVD